MTWTLVAQLESGFHDSKRLGGAVIGWHRTILPAPSTPTFNDVPTTHQFYRHIQALANSGITDGCGAGSFCPNAPVTRGQMAAFLSTALGLHWAF